MKAIFIPHNIKKNELHKLNTELKGVFSIEKEIPSNNGTIVK